ncbi:MAG: hypothetical protein EAZ99_08550 [Alphaproteobacteria bacterium]|nr:MAG: hypothetical protein EAZ99_08550 [Alphaproteobacteria bacterium]
MPIRIGWWLLLGAASLAVSACVTPGGPPPVRQTANNQGDRVAMFARSFDAGQSWQGTTWVTPTGQHLACSVERVGRDGVGLGILETDAGVALRLIRPDATRIPRGRSVNALVQLDGRRNDMTVAAYVRLQPQPGPETELRSGYMNSSGVEALQRANRASIVVPDLSGNPVVLSLAGSSRAIDMLRQCQQRRGDVAALRPPPPPAAPPRAPATARPRPGAPESEEAVAPALDGQQPTSPWAEPPPAPSAGGWMEPPAAAPAPAPAAPGGAPGPAPGAGGWMEPPKPT